MPTTNDPALPNAPPPRYAGINSLLSGESAMPQPDRRQLLGALAAVPLAAAAEPQANRITEENACAGTTDWQLTYTRVDAKSRYRCPWIEGYAGRTSVKPGESLDLFVSTQ